MSKDDRHPRRRHHRDERQAHRLAVHLHQRACTEENMIRFIISAPLIQQAGENLFPELILRSNIP